ncbi:hypothetical protein [Aquimarina pacifica]|uniref:hypothetical protein n=1 Tax=Aquimarina pacifica TaxID=1296415 RepID=UPI000470CC0B|nr:hypothetical protein [Aquimarina pacifica]
MNNIGIWMDREKAYVITTGVEGEQMLTVFSEIEEYNIHGGSGTRIKGGPQDVVQDSKYLEREKHQFKEYFKKLTVYLKEANVIVLYGPAEAAEKFQKYLTKYNKGIADKIKDVIRVDSMTKNQMTALVRNYFKKSSEGVF